MPRKNKPGFLRRPRHQPGRRYSVLIMTDKATVELPQASSQGLGRGRIVAGSVFTVVGLTLLTLVLVAARDSLALASVVLLYLVAVVTIAVIGGIWPALA